MNTNGTPPRGLKDSAGRDDFEFQVEQGCWDLVGALREPFAWDFPAVAETLRLMVAHAIECLGRDPDAPARHRPLSVVRATLDAEGEVADELRKAYAELHKPLMRWSGRDGRLDAWAAEAAYAVAERVASRAARLTPIDVDEEAA